MDHPRDIAWQALGSYDLAPRSVVLAAESFNSIFRVTAASGTYALRVGPPLRIHTEGALQAENDWLRRLGERGVVVPVLHTNRLGAPGTEVATHDGGTRTCALFDWVAGRSLRNRLTAPTAAAMGRLAARLHADAEAWGHPGPSEVPIADEVLYWRLPVRLTAPDVPSRDVFGEALARAQAGLDLLWRHGPHRPHLLHGDLTPANVVVGREGVLVPIDFQDVVWGFDLQDLAISIAALRRASSGTHLVDAFRKGYAERRPWPVLSDELLDTLVAARVLNQVNLTVNVRRPADVGEYLADQAQRLGDWLRTPATAT